MADDLLIALEAHNPERNHHRRYEIIVGRDLLRDWTVTVRYGRVGGSYREERFGNANAEALRSIVRSRLRRRLLAPRRIGCRYRLVMLSAAQDLEADRWFPHEMVARFLSAQSK